MNNETISIPKRKLQDFQKYVEKLNRKAKKYNFPPIAWKIEKEFHGVTSFIYEENLKYVNEDYVEIEINDIKIKIGNYYLAGIVESVGLDKLENGYKHVITFKRIPTDDVIPDFNIQEKHKENNCDHCGIDRFRTKTFILYSKKENMFKQVGSTCLNDYIGLKTAMEYAEYLACIVYIKDNFNDDLEKFYDDNLAVLNFIVFRAKSIIDKEGRFVSKKEAFERNMPRMSTAAKVIDKEVKINLSKEEIEKMESEVLNIIDTIKNINPTNDFEKSIKALCDSVYIFRNNIGLACAAVKYYIDLKCNTNNKSQWVGNIKNKIESKMFLEKISSFGGCYGEIFIYKFIDGDGNIFIWKTSDKNIEKGWYNIKGTIKEHKEYKSEKQTILTRCKIDG